MTEHLSPSDHDCESGRTKRRAIARGEPYLSNHAQVRPRKKPALKWAGKAIAVLWLIATPRPKEFSLKSFQWDLIQQLKLEDVAEELAGIGLLERVRNHAGTTPSSWADAYRLAPLEEPLDQNHSAMFRRITECMLKYWESGFVSELRAVPGLISKLLGGIRHRRPDLRHEYDRRFMRRS